MAPVSEKTLLWRKLDKILENNLNTMETLVFTLLEMDKEVNEIEEWKSEFRRYKFGDLCKFYNSYYFCIRAHLSHESNVKTDDNGFPYLTTLCWVRRDEFDFEDKDNDGTGTDK